MQQEAISSMRMCLNISGTLAMHLSATECRVCRSAEMAGSWLRWRKWWRGQVGVEVEVEEKRDGGFAISRDFFMQADNCIVGGEGKKDCQMDSVQIANSIPRDEYL